MTIKELVISGASKTDSGIGTNSAVACTTGDRARLAFLVSGSDGGRGIVSFDLILHWPNTDSYIIAESCFRALIELRVGASATFAF